MYLIKNLWHLKERWEVRLCGCCYVMQPVTKPARDDVDLMANIPWYVSFLSSHVDMVSRRCTMLRFRKLEEQKTKIRLGYSDRDKTLAVIHRYQHIGYLCSANSAQIPICA